MRINVMLLLLISINILWYNMAFKPMYENNLYQHEPQEYLNITDDQLIMDLESHDLKKADRSVRVIFICGIRMIPKLIKCKGNRNYFYGSNLGDPNSETVIPVPYRGSKPDKSRAITIEVVALYIISAIYYQALDFASTPYLTDNSLPERLNTFDRVTKAWIAVEDWFVELDKLGIENLRKMKYFPLKSSGLKFWAEPRGHLGSDQDK